MNVMCRNTGRIVSKRYCEYCIKNRLSGRFKTEDLKKLEQEEDAEKSDASSKTDKEQT